MPSFELRPYQEACIAALNHDVAAGYKSLGVQAATGTGKTVIFLAWLDSVLRDEQRALILAHRKELIEQPIEKARRFFPRLASKMGAVQAENNNISARVVVATVQTLNVCGRLESVLEHGAFNYLVVDEMHHDTADTYRYVEDRLRQANPNLVKIGFTATPIRTDGYGLFTVGDRRGVYDKMSYRYPVQAAIRDGALCPFNAYAVGVKVSIANIRETPDGWDNEALGDVLNAANVWEIVLAAWRGEIDGLPDSTWRKTIVFTASVRQSIGGMDFFRREGIAAEHIDGGTPDNIRDAILKRFASGETQVLVNCQVLTEGFDVPDASCVLMVSPTKSPLVWVQKAGRVLRLVPEWPEKSAVIIDFYPRERGNIFAADALGIPRDVRKALDEAESTGVLVSGLGLDRFGRTTTIDTDRVFATMLNLMARSGLSWTLSGRIATAALTGDTMAAISLPDPIRLEKAEAMRHGESWTQSHERLYEFIKSVRLYRITKAGAYWTADLVSVFDTPDKAKDEVESWPADQVLALRRCRWRSELATDKQINYLRRLTGVSHNGITRGDAARLISEALAVQAVERAERDIAKNFQL